MKRILVLILLALGLLAFSPPLQNQDLTLQVQAGINSWYRAGKWIPLQINVDSENATVDGRLQVRVVTENLNATESIETVYQTPFTIAPQSSKRVFLYISVDDFTRNIQIELLDQEDNVVISSQETLTMLNYNDMVSVVVTDSAAGVIDVSREPVGSGTHYQTGWRIDDIPPNPDALSAIDVMVFSDVNSAQLSLDQQQALTNWVRSGGHLMVTGGSNWQRTTSGLLDLLPVEPIETTTLDDITTLVTFLGLPESESEALASETLIARTELKPDTEVMLSAEDVPLIARWRVGVGHVDFVAFDSTTEPLRSWNDLPLVWQELVLRAEARPSWTHGIERFGFLRDAASNVNFDLPSFLQLAAFLALYIALIGPVNYVVLNLLGRLEFAWLTIPALIAGFTAFAYFTGFSVRGDDVTVSQVSMVQVWEGSDQARVDGVIGILSPRRTTYDVLVEGDFNLRSLPNVSDSQGVNQIRIEEGETYAAQDIPVDAAIMTTFTSSGYIAAPDIQGSAEIVLRSETVAPRFAGTITNNTTEDLSDAVVVVANQFVRLGDIAAGVSVEFSENNLDFTLPARLPTGSRVSPDRPVVPVSFNTTTQPLLGTLSRISCYSTGGFEVVYQYVMNGQTFECSGGASETELELRRRALLLQATNNEIDFNGGREARAYLFAWTQTPTINVTIPDTGQIDKSTTLLIYEIPTTITYVGDEYFVPPGLMNWTLIEQGELNRLPETSLDSLRLSGEQAVALRFAPMANVPIEEVSEIEIAYNARVSIADVRLHLWNWQTAEWDEIEVPEEAEAQFIIRDEAYLGFQNVVQVLIEADNTSTGQTIREFRIGLRG